MAYHQIHPSIEYHNIIMTLWEPFAASARGHDQTCQRLLADAGDRLQTLLRVYYLRHGFGATDVFLCQPLALTGFLCLKAIGQHASPERVPDLGSSRAAAAELEALRSTLFLAAKGLHDQGRSHYLARTLFLVIHSQMRAEEASLMRAIASVAGEDGGAEEARQTQMHAVVSHWPVSAVSKSDGPEVPLTRLFEMASLTDPGDEGKARQGMRSER